ncbi:activity-dependent neuroprotector homeobox protein 2b [Eucyclogobius newberryi]|uniref:activity-dependent neuroprotector homeobox protein 2b n=1 Tax=Eucyclogobius newberryi TaxID=166745 RepID=UPI003B5B8D2F
MYQIPVTSVEKIRKARKSVKKVLSDIGLEDCQEYLKSLNENLEKNSDDNEDTEWVELTEGFNGRMEKRWPYRSRSLCCAMCKYSTQNVYNFRSHVSRCHSFMQSLCSLGVCNQCTFTGHPKVLRKHAFLFHGQTPTDSQQTKESAVTHRANERYNCQKCGFPASLIFAMKKHIILKHLGKLAEKYIGYRYISQGGKTLKIYCCKVCKGNTGTLDQMLHHMLVSPTHYNVSTQVQSYIYENKNYAPKPTVNGNGIFLTLPNIVSKAQQQHPQLLNTNTLVLPTNGQPGGTVLTLQGTQNSATLICAPGSNQGFLPPQASALVQLASAEAKGLLQPGATITLQGSLSQGQSVQIPTVSNVAIKSATLPMVQASAQPKPIQQPQPILFASGLQANGTPLAAAAVKPAATTQIPAQNPHTLQGTMLTSQSLLSHLIPTGNRVNGMPTYTFAPLQVTMPASQSTATPLQPIEQTNNSQVKKWVTCPHCNELFPSNVFDMHTEVVHQVKSTSDKSEHLVARAPFLKKMADKSMKCLTCKILVTETTIFQHLLHGLNCVSCPSVFFSIKQLGEHVKQHNPTSKAYSDFLKLNCKIFTQSPGVLSFPHFDVQTTGPKEVLGDNEVHLALITSTNEHMYFKLRPCVKSNPSTGPAKVSSTYCPFCDEKSPNEVKHLQHLKQKHFVAPTIHAILKSEAFKCIYCNGVYTGKVTQQAVMLHIHRCRCSPKQPQPSKPAPEPARTTMTLTRATPAKPVQQMTTRAPGLYFLQVPQGMTIKQALAPASALGDRTVRKDPNVQLKTSEEVQSQKRIEEALKAVMEANKREREERAVKRQKLDYDRSERQKVKVEPHVQEKPSPEPQVNPAVKLVLEPTTTERRNEDERRLFCIKYFNCNPHATKAETEELCRRLSMSKSELVAIFGARRSKCMKTIKNNRAVVLLGFSMTELKKMKHNLDIPEQQPPETSDQTEQDTDGEHMEVENEEQKEAPEKPMETEQPQSEDEKEI